MTRARRLRPGVVLCATLAGFALAHALDYALVFPDAAERADVLEHTGHAYLGALGSVAWPLLGLAFAGALAAGLGRRSSRALSNLEAVALLAGVQSAFFVSAELCERVAAHESPTDLVRTPLLLVGLAAQVVVAALLVGLLAALDAVGRRYPLAPPARLPRLVASRARTPYVTAFHPTLRAVRATARAPPAA